MSIKHLLSYIVRGTSSEALQKLLEMTPSNLRTEVHALKRFCKRFWSSPSYILQRRSGHIVWETQWNLVFPYKLEFVLHRVEVQRGEIWTVSWPGLGLVRPSDDSASKLSFTNSKAAFVQCGGALSCIHQREERVAKWRSLGQIMSCTNLRYETPLTEDKWPSSSRNAWTIGTISLIMETKNITLASFLSFFFTDISRISFAHTPSFFRWGFWCR